jgi:hypothetical protein
MRRFTVLTVAVIVLLSAVRIFAATVLPEFNYDEARRAEAAQDLADGGDFDWDAFKIGPIPIFVRTDAGFSSLPFLAPATVWAFFFGNSPQSLRVLIAIITTLSLILLAHAIALWYKKSPKVFLLAAIIGLTLPWTFLQGFIFWDTSLAPVCFILAFYAFTRLKFGASPKLRHQLLLPLSLITAVYLYLPSAVPAFVLYLAAIAYLKKNNIINIKQLLINFAVAFVAILPFVVFFLTFPDGNTRTQELNIFYQVDAFTGIRRLFKNIALLISPTFLFITGDPSRSHSIGMMGMLGPLAIAPLVWTIYYNKMLVKKEKLLFAISILGVAVATFASALTHPDAQPHSLRANAAVPFYIALIVLGTQKFLQQHPKATIPVYVLLGISIVAYYVSFFLVYLETGRAAFTH